VPDGGVAGQSPEVLDLLAVLDALDVSGREVCLASTVCLSSACDKSKDGKYVHVA